MNELLSVKDQLLQTFHGMVQTVVGALPLVLTAMVLLVVAVVVAKIVEKILRLILVRMRFDSMLQRVGIDKTLQKIGVRQSLNHFVPRIVYFLLLFLFAQTAVDALGLTTIADAMSAFFSYLPNLLSALLLVFLGSAAAQFAGRAVSNAAKESGIEFSGSLGAAVSGLILFIVGIMAVAQLKIDTDIVRLVTAGSLAGIALAFGLSFGLGSRDVTRNILAGFYARRIFSAGDELEVRGERGVLQAITPTQTILEQETGRVAFSNSVFLEEVVRQ